MTFLDAIRSGFSNYVTFSGRATRPEFWWWVLFVLLVGAVTNVIDGALIAPILGFGAFEENAGQPLSVLVGLGLLLPSLAVSVRRLHDIGRSGWWVLIGLVPIIGTIILIYWYVQPSSTDANR